MSTLNEDQIAERGARLARRDDREYREYLREQRRQPGCPACEVVLDQRGHATRCDGAQHASAPTSVAPPCYHPDSVMRTAFARLGRQTATAAGVIVALMIWPFARHLVDLRAAPEAPPEVRAIGVIRAVQKAQAMYSAAFGYYDRLECLIQASCVPNPYPPSYLSPNAFRSTAFGYRFRLHEGQRAVARGGEALSAGGMQAFAMVAVPLEQPTEQRAFCGDDSGEVYVTSGVRPPEVEAGRCVDTSAPLR